MKTHREAMAGNVSCQVSLGSRSHFPGLWAELGFRVYGVIQGEAEQSRLHLVLEGWLESPGPLGHGCVQFPRAQDSGRMNDGEDRATKTKRLPR